LGDRPQQTHAAYLPEDLSEFKIPESQTDIAWLVAFMDFCRIIDAPPIQMVI
jgi:hypothetical protein